MSIPKKVILVLSASVLLVANIVYLPCQRVFREPLVSAARAGGGMLAAVFDVAGDTETANELRRGWATTITKPQNGFEEIAFPILQGIGWLGAYALLCIVLGTGIAFGLTAVFKRPRSN